LFRDSEIRNYGHGRATVYDLKRPIEDMADYDIFASSLSTENRRRRPAWWISIAVHALLVIGLLRGRSPVFVAPSSVLGGANGTVVTHLYWATGSDADGKPSGKSAEQRTDSSSRLTWKKSQSPKSKVDADRVTHKSAVEESSEIASAAVNPAASAGTAYGSLSDGASAGHEIRAALPAVTVEPLVSPDDLRGGIEGNVVVEITIDESGNIVNKVVVQSLGAGIDGKVLAALENWRFRPATRDGVPIPSKQDVVYHFKPR
jgi:TonB family protein